jgi:hypothetical protein
LDIGRPPVQEEQERIAAIVAANGDPLFDAADRQE